MSRCYVVWFIISIVQEFYSLNGLMDKSADTLTLGLSLLWIRAWTGAHIRKISAAYGSQEVFFFLEASVSAHIYFISEIKGSKAHRTKQN